MKVLINTLNKYRFSVVCIDKLKLSDSKMTSQSGMNVIPNACAKSMAYPFKTYLFSGRFLGDTAR